MFVRNRFLAGASAIALAAGATLAGAGIAGAQGSSEIAADLELAATALNGPVSVAGDDDGGPTVTYTNETGVDETCVGFAMPYASVEEVGLDPSAGGGLTMLPQIIEIENLGGVSILSATESGEPTAFDAVLPSSGFGNVGGAVLLLANNDFRTGVPVADGESITWDATSPEESAAAAVLCMPDSETDNGERLAAMTVNFGIDPQVVADQINGRIPGGSLEIVSADDISAGSVGMGATLLGSLGDDGADEVVDNGDGGDVEEDTDTASGSASGSGSGDDDGDDEDNGTLTAATLTN